MAKPAAKPVSDTVTSAVDRKTETVRLQGNTEYAKVATRIVEFHSDNKECSIETEIDFKEGENLWVVITAKVTSQRGVFVAHSLGPFSSQQKFLEKLETVAVGRALAFAGYMASGYIASMEEMEEYSGYGTVVESAFTDRLLGALKKADTQEALDELQAKVNQQEESESITAEEAEQWSQRIRQKRKKVA